MSSSSRRRCPPEPAPRRGAGLPRRAPGAGQRAARGLLRGLWLLGAFAVGTGCLVTERPDYTEENVPANVRVVSPSTFTRVPPERDPLCTSEEMWMRFEAQVHDANLEDVLSGRVLVNGVRIAQSSVNAIVPTGEEDRGVVPFCLSRGNLRRACNRVELLVSRQFDEGPTDYSTRDPNDFAKVEWWVLGPASEYPQVSADECERHFLDGGVP